MDFDGVIKRLDQVAVEILTTGHGLPPWKVGLEYRSGDVVVGEDWIATSTPFKLDYYGGFDSVNHEDWVKLGPWKFYSAKDFRVKQCIDYYKESQ